MINVALSGTHPPSYYSTSLPKTTGAMKVARKAILRSLNSGQRSEGINEFGPTCIENLEVNGGVFYRFLGADVADDGTSVPGALSALNDVFEEFQERCECFAKKNRKFVRVKDDVHTAIRTAAREQDIKRAALIFVHEISSAIHTIEKRQEASRSKWTGKLGTFIAKLYPVARLSLRLTSAVAEVRTNSESADPRVQTFCP